MSDHSHDIDQWLQKAYQSTQSNCTDAYFNDHETHHDNWQIHLPLLTVDFSRHALDAQILEKLWQKLKSHHFLSFQAQLWDGTYCNATEQRAQWHMQSRRPKGQGLIEIEYPLTQLQQWVEALHRDALVLDGQQTPIKHVLYLGCGGSEIGQHLLCQVAAQYGEIKQPVDFISTIDSARLTYAIQHYDPKQTLVIMASKSFKTIEVFKNAQTIKTWLNQSLTKTSVMSRFFAITSQVEKAQAWGIGKTQIFQMPENLSGRFSLWSTMGAAIAISAGWPAFESLRAGAFAMDQHWQLSPWQKNAPIILGLLSYWYRQVCGYQAHGIIPYADMLKTLPTYLQQLSMESLGKVAKDRSQSGPVIFGSAGTGAQHTFFQWLHQSASGTPIDMIACVQPHLSDQDNAFLWANCVAQADLLFKGQKAPWPKTLPGNRPSSIIWIKDRSLAGIGALLALYEHQVFVESVLYEINPFDQFGVEAGKQLAQQCQHYLEHTDQPSMTSFQPATLLKEMSSFMSEPAHSKKDKVN